MVETPETSGTVYDIEKGGNEDTIVGFELGFTCLGVDDDRVDDGGGCDGVEAGTTSHWLIRD